MQNKKIYISTGIKALDAILSLDETIDDDPSSRGLLIGMVKDNSDRETPIILVNGPTGTGKTTLALQIAFSAAKQNCITFFYALEQTSLSLEKLASNFGNFEPANTKYKTNNISVEFCDLAKKYHKKQIAECIDGSPEVKKIHLCHFSPKPISEVENHIVFEKRFSELQHMVEKLSEEIDSTKFMLFFIDSLNAFSSKPLSRNEIHRVFSLFRTYHIPAILTMEHPQSNHNSIELAYLESAKFLSDIVISLSKENIKDYLRYYLEIEKSRVCRQSLGKNLYKIRTYPNAKKINLDPRTGIVLYPSIHSVLSSARNIGKIKEQPNFYICNNKEDDLYQIMKNETIMAGECISIIGPQGTHKLALGMNLSMGYLEGKPAKLLIVNFGGSGNFNFKGVAWTKNREYCINLQPVNLKAKNPESDNSHMKFSCTDYICKEKKSVKASATILTFQLGQLTPEECFYITESIITESIMNKDDKFSSVLLSDTAELCSGFPLLVSDPLFLPALIDIFKEQNLVTVCIGVDSKLPSTSAGINFTLSSRADYRIMLSHYPEKYELNKIIAQSNIDSKEPPFKEQLISLVIDNVSGKHYERELKWIRVEQMEERKVLHCELKPYIENKNGENPKKH